MKIKKSFAALLTVAPWVAVAFQPSLSCRTTTALSYQHQNHQQPQTDNTTARAKDCVEHFGQCSVDELQELQSTLSRKHSHNRQDKRLEQDLAHQLDLLRAHEQDTFFVDSEPALVERVRECVEDYGACSLPEMQNLQSAFHEMAQESRMFGQDNIHEQEWLEDGLKLQMRLRQEQEKKKPKGAAKSLYPESPLVDRARKCADEYGVCSMDELEELYAGLNDCTNADFHDDSEKTWLQNGLELQLRLRQEDLHPKHRRHHHKRVRRYYEADDEPSLYPEVPIVDEARNCIENFGKCSLEQLESVQRRLNKMLKVFESFEGMSLFEDEAEQKWVEDGLALQIKLLKKQSNHNEAVSDERDEIYFLYPETGAMDRARECAENFGECSIEEMQDLIPTLEHLRKNLVSNHLYTWLKEDEMKWIQDGLELQIELQKPRGMKYDHDRLK